jgi:SOS-response transcriptional repressor LexA
MTPKERKTLDFIASEIARQGYPPSYDEIMDHLGLHSKSGVHRIVHSLARQGEVEFDPVRARSIRLGSARSAMKEIAAWLKAARSGEAEANVALAGIGIVVARCGEPA